MCMLDICLDFIEIYVPFPALIDVLQPPKDNDLRSFLLKLFALSYFFLIFVPSYALKRHRCYAINDMKQSKFKYQKQIDELVAHGCKLPSLYAPNGMSANRFVFSDESHQNHLPQYVSNPKRMLRDIEKHNMSTSLLALSCFSSATKAELFYGILCKSFKKVALTIGDSLAEGHTT